MGFNPVATGIGGLMGGALAGGGKKVAAPAPKIPMSKKAGGMMQGMGALGGGMKTNKAPGAKAGAPPAKLGFGGGGRKGPRGK